MDGPWNPEQGHRFDSSKILLDPYARAIGGRDVWGVTPDWDNVFPHRGRVVFEDFDWEGDRPLETPIEDLIGTRRMRAASPRSVSGVRFPQLRRHSRKDPVPQRPSASSLELLPIFEFDEFENSRTHSETGELLLNFWGYSTVGFFAPKTGMPPPGKFGMQVDELKGLVKALHQNGSKSSWTSCSTTPRRATKRARPSRSAASTIAPTTLTQRATTTTSAGPGTRSTATTRRPQHGPGLPALTGRPSTTSTASASTWRPSSGAPSSAPLPNPPARITCLRPDSGQIQAHRRSLGRGWPVPGRELPGVRPVGRVAWQVPGYDPPLPQR